MAKNDNHHVRPKKFLFDVNNFNDDVEEEIIEEAPPPPPTFSEAELEAARKRGYDEGKRDGLAEATASREKFVSGILETISKSFTALFADEHKRNALYENESVHLARAIFRKLFPALNERHGMDEVRAVIARVLEGSREQPEIIVEVHPDYIADIESHIAQVMAAWHSHGTCAVTGNPALGPGDCRLQWAAGGGQRHAARLAGEIEKELDQVLADKAMLHDNKEDANDIADSENSLSSADAPGDRPEETPPGETPRETPGETP
jgi:flagellar assembly protein FliH